MKNQDFLTVLAHAAESSYDDLANGIELRKHNLTTVEAFNGAVAGIIRYASDIMHALGLVKTKGALGDLYEPIVAALERAKARNIAVRDRVYNRVLTPEIMETLTVSVMRDAFIENAKTKVDIATISRIITLVSYYLCDILIQPDNRGTDGTALQSAFMRGIEDAIKLPEIQALHTELNQSVNLHISPN